MLNRIILRRLSAAPKIPVLDLSRFLKEGRDPEVEKAAAEAFHKLGVLVIKDPRVEYKQNEEYIDMIEQYFSGIASHYYKTNKFIDVFPQNHFQTGATPELKELAKPHPEIMKLYAPGNEPTSPQQPILDAKWRYLWKIGSTVDQHSPPRHSPYAFPRWQELMDNWGNAMVNACMTVAELSALGLGLSKDQFTSKMEGGPHMLAPTASDLTRYKPGTVFAGFHYDFNFLTIHGKSRYPGLFCWTRENQKFRVAVPEGHLLLQAGKEFEMLTGGYINCGYHEVIYTNQVQAAKDRAMKEGRIPWRVSSTLFSHIRYDVDLSPIGRFLTEESRKKYPKKTAYEHSMEQLESINLSK